MMKRVNIFEHQLALVFRKENFIRVLKPGLHWIRLWDEVLRYRTTEEFKAPVDLDILLQDPNMTELLELIEVGDTQIALHYEHGNFKEVLDPGRYVFWKSVINREFRVFDTDQIEIPVEIKRKVLQTKELLPYVRVFQVAPFEKALLLVEGNLTRQLSAGAHYFWKNEKAINVLKADLRKQQLEVTGQEMLTKDKAALRINFIAQYQIVDVEKALLENKEVQRQLYFLLQLALREYTGTLSLDELLARKEEVRLFVLDQVKSKAEALGIEVISAGIRDIILPGEVKDIMNQVLIAQKKAQANIITRREETASTRSLLNTAKLMEDNAMLLKLKEMEYVEKIAEKISNISLSGGTQVVDQLRQIFLKGE